MMNGEFVKEFKQAMGVPTVLPSPTGENRILVPPGYSDITPKLPTVGPLEIGTLTGVVGYVKDNPDGLELMDCLAHVVDHATVAVRSNVGTESVAYRRHTFLVASTDDYGKPFPFGVFQDAETFFIALQSQFVATPQRDEILKLLASIRESAVRDTVDSGVSQEVKTAGGVVLVGSTKVPNPVTLQPYRTFREVEQPESLFVLRLQPGKEGEKPRCGLFEADGGAWKLEAIKRIAGYLTEKVGGHIDIIA